MASKRKREEDTDSEKGSRKRIKLSNTNKPLPSSAIDVYEDILHHYRMNRAPKYFKPQKLRAKLSNALQFKKNIPLLQDMKEEQDASFECAIWKETVRGKIPKILIAGMYVDVRKVIMCIYAPLCSILEHTTSVDDTTCEMHFANALLKLVSRTRLVPKCDNKCCVNWRHYLK